MTKIILSHGFSIEAKETNVLLKLVEKRTKLDPDTLEDIEVEHREIWYFLSLKQALNRYKDLVLKPCETIDQVLERLEILEQTINSIKI